MQQKSLPFPSVHSTADQTSYPGRSPLQEVSASVGYYCCMLHVLLVRLHLYRIHYTLHIVKVPDSHDAGDDEAMNGAGGVERDVDQDIHAAADGADDVDDVDNDAADDDGDGIGEDYDE
mmetsp:Transcript_47040/g.54319  ORF Transcript_47040/g.54319 Transcript_47040/m.54319 type:complete len:119 (-) Transcript_47040:1099-1455(-)